MLSKTMRVIFATLGAFLFYCIGYMTLPWIAYGIREWRTLLAVLSMTSVVNIPLWWSVSSPTKLLATPAPLADLSPLTCPQVHPRVAALADHPGPAGGGRGHPEGRRQEEQGPGSTRHLQGD